MQDMSYKDKLALWSSATYNCKQCGKLVARKDKPKIIYHAFTKLKYCGYDCAARGLETKLPEAFWANVQKGPNCWLWTGSINSKGYGLINVGGRKIYAHRYSLELATGPIGDAHALHSCDNPPCVNPDHLRPGTHQENMRDAAERGRIHVARGEASHRAKLTEQQARYILECRAGPAELARQFGVAPSTIRAVRTGQNWKELHNASTPTS